MKTVVKTGRRSTCAGGACCSANWRLWWSIKNCLPVTSGIFNDALSVNAVRRSRATTLRMFLMIAARAKRGYRRAAAHLSAAYAAKRSVSANRSGLSSAGAEKTYPRESRFVSAGG